MSLDRNSFDLKIISFDPNYHLIKIYLLGKLTNEYMNELTLSHIFCIFEVTSIYSFGAFFNFSISCL